MKVFELNAFRLIVLSKPLHTNPFPLLLALIGSQVKQAGCRIPAGHTAYVGVSATVIAGDRVGQLFVERRMFLQVKAPEMMLGRARRRGPKAEREPQALAQAARFAGRFNHVENNSAVKKERKERAGIVMRGNGFTNNTTVGQVDPVEDQASEAMQLTVSQADSVNLLSGHTSSLLPFPSLLDLARRGEVERLKGRQRICCVATESGTGGAKFSCLSRT